MSDSHRVSVVQWLRTGWATYRRHALVLIVASVILAAINWAMLFVMPRGPEAAADMGRTLTMQAVFYLFIIFVGGPLYVGWLNLCLRAVRDEPVGVSGLFGGFARYWPVLGTVVLFGLICLAAAVPVAVLSGILMAAVTMSHISAGSPPEAIPMWPMHLPALLQMIPMLIVMVVFGLSVYSVLDRRLGPAQSLGDSRRITRGHRWALAGLLVVFWATGLAGMPAALAWMGAEEQVSQAWRIPQAAFLVLRWIGIPLVAAGAVLLAPWLSAAHAAAYDELQRIAPVGEEPAQPPPQPVTPKPPGDILSAARKRQEGGPT